MRIAHISDIHYCDKYLDEVNRCAAYTSNYLQQIPLELIVLSGDLFEHRLEQNSSAFLAAVAWVHDLAKIAPVLILQGTRSHDAPDALSVLRHVESSNQIRIADTIQQIMFGNEGFVPLGAIGDPKSIGHGEKLIISCLPAINKGAVAALVGAEDAAVAVGEHVSALLHAWSMTHQAARANLIPSIIVSHGTVSESITEHGVPMAGLDHEYSTGVLFAADASAVMLGHIHKMQSWDRDGRKIAYPGSLGRLHFGEVDPKGFLIWDVQPNGATFEFIETPAKRLVEVAFTGVPDMNELQKIAASSVGAHVRIRYRVDAEHKDSVDKEAIQALFDTAAVIKMEGTINPVQRTRAQGIGQAVSLADKLKLWCEHTQSDPAPLLERLEKLQSQNAEQILEELSCM